jgi:hypothetical protein
VLTVTPMLAATAAAAAAGSEARLAGMDRGGMPGRLGEAAAATAAAAAAGSEMVGRGGAVWGLKSVNEVGV